MKSLRIYVAAPLSAKKAKKRKENVLRAIDAGEAVYRMGHVPFIPHLDAAWQARYPKDWQSWIDFDLRWLEVCDACLRLKGKSPGADVEVQFCLERGIPVYYSLKDLRVALKPTVKAI